MVAWTTLVCKRENGVYVDDVFQGREAKRTQLPLSLVKINMASKHNLICIAVML